MNHSVVRIRHCRNQVELGITVSGAEFVDYLGPFSWHIDKPYPVRDQTWCQITHLIILRGNSIMIRYTFFFQNEIVNAV